MSYYLTQMFVLESSEQHIIHLLSRQWSSQEILHPPWNACIIGVHWHIHSHTQACRKYTCTNKLSEDTEATVSPKGRHMDNNVILSFFSLVYFVVTCGCSKKTKTRNKKKTKQTKNKQNKTITLKEYRSHIL